MAELTIAIAKGRLQDEALRLFRQVGVSVSDEPLGSRRLLVTDSTGLVSFLLVKPADVPVYVEYGVADVGVCGYDVLLESGADVHCPLDLGFGGCRLVVAGRPEVAAMGYDPVVTARVATKYPRVAADYFQQRGVPVEIILLSGSVELASVLGLADRIVDLVETGRTLEDNGLVVIDTIATSTARLIVNRASYHLKRSVVVGIINSLRDEAARRESQSTLA